MKHYFIVNPVSGKGKAAKAYIPVIEKYIRENNLDAEIYVTKAFRDGQKYVEEIAKKGEPVRFYSCGGDGTIYEVVDTHVNGVPTKLDLIFTEGKVAINQCSMGIDAEVCAKQSEFKKLPLVSGEAAYDLSLLYCMAGKLKSEFKVTIDGEVFEDTFLFCYVGNSRWYGGGYKAAPLADPADGLIDVVMIKLDRSRLKLLPLISKYKAGEHLDWDITTFRRAKKVEIESKKIAAVNVDGECEYVNKRTFEMMESAITFVVPKGSPYLEGKK